MAVARAADAYVGSYDELGCTALMSGRLAVLLGGATGDQADRISRREAAMWFPGATGPAALSNAVLQFLSHHLVPGGGSDERNAR